MSVKNGATIGIVVLPSKRKGEYPSNSAKVKYPFVPTCVYSETMSVTNF